MIGISVCAAQQDMDAALAIVSRLERTAEVYVRVETVSGPLNETWDLGLDASGLILLLSPDSVPERSGRDTWGTLLDHLSERRGPPIASVVVRLCAFPPILRRNNFFDWADAAALRDLQAWALALHPPVEPAGISPASLPDASPLPEYLWAMLVDGSGVATVTDVRAAQEFAYRARRFYRDVVWVAAEGRSAEFVASEFESARQARKHRVLVVFHGSEVELEDDPGAHGSAIVIPPVQLEPAEHDSPLWRAIGVCTASCFPLELALEISAGGDSLELEHAGLIDCLDRTQKLYRFRRRPPLPAPETRAAHAAAVTARFSRWRKDPDAAGRVGAELERALEWAIANDWPAALRLGRNAADYFRNKGHLHEAGAVLDTLIEEAGANNDREAERELLSELSWIRNDILMPRSEAPAIQLTFDLQL